MLGFLLTGMDECLLGDEQMKKRNCSSICKSGGQLNDTQGALA